MKRVLVTGGCGFIGGEVVRKLLHRGYEVEVLDDLTAGTAGYIPERVRLHIGSVLDVGSVREVVAKREYVLHLAALPYIPESFSNPLKSYEVNALGTAIVLEACAAGEVTRVVVASSAEVYGDARAAVLNESLPISPLSPYAASKAAGEIIANAYWRCSKLPVVVLRLFNVFGPRETHPYFVPEMIRQCLKQDAIQVGKLEVERDFAYVEDTAEAIVVALECAAAEGEVINIGSGHPVRMVEILDNIRHLTGVQRKEVVIDPGRLRPLDPPRLVADIGKARALLGWKPTTRLEAGLKATIAWYRSAGAKWAYEERVLAEVGY